MIRSFELEDAEEVVQVREKCLEQLKQQDPVNYAGHRVDKRLVDLPVQKLVALSKESNRMVFVAEVNSQVVGSGCLIDNEIRLMFVDPSEQKKGIGTSILSRIESAALQKGIKELNLYSFLGAVQFYKCKGFEVTGKAHVSPMGPIVPMKKILHQ